MAEIVEPVGGARPADPVGSHAHGGAHGEPHRKGIVGDVVAVHLRNAHHEGSHRLDISVGAEEHTEVVVRVVAGSCQDLQGKRVVLYVAE